MPPISEMGKHSLEGILERIVYFNDEDNYVVAKLQVKSRRELVTIVGNLSANPGETLRLKGEWVTNKRFGEQFKVESCLSIIPATLTGIEMYLGSGFIKGRQARRAFSPFSLCAITRFRSHRERP